jgi:hypothetical protein
MHRDGEVYPYKASEIMSTHFARRKPLFWAGGARMVSGARFHQRSVICLLFAHLVPLHLEMR